MNIIQTIVILTITCSLTILWTEIVVEQKVNNILKNEMVFEISK